MVPCAISSRATIFAITSSSCSVFQYFNQHPAEKINSVSLLNKKENTTHKNVIKSSRKLFKKPSPNFFDGESGGCFSF
jgi:hypothetical protein